MLPTLLTRHLYAFHMTSVTCTSQRTSRRNSHDYCSHMANSGCTSSASGGAPGSEPDVHDRSMVLSGAQKVGWICQDGSGQSSRLVSLPTQPPPDRQIGRRNTSSSSTSCSTGQWPYQSCSFTITVVCSNATQASISAQIFDGSRRIAASSRPEL